MALKIWLPLDGNLENKGISNYTITSSGSSVVSSGKIGSCMKITSSTSLGYTPDFNTNSLSFGGWFKFNLNEIKTKVDTLTYSSSATSPTGNLLGNTSYGGIGLVWTGNNHYSSGTFSSMSVFATLRTSSVNQSTSSIAIEFDKWIHIMLTWNPNTHILSLYKDGILVNSKTFSEFTNGVSRVLSLNYNAIYGGNGPAASIPIYCNDVRIYDHCLSAAEVHEISQGLVLHYKLDTQYFKSGTNLVTDVTKGGQTTKLTDGRLGVVTSGTNADTYFTINLSETITNGTTYHFSCDASGISEGQFWNFPLGAQNNTSLPCKIYNGHNEFVFTANDINWGTNRLFMDDLNRPDWQHPATFYNFILTKDATYEVKDSSGYGHNGTIVGDLILNAETKRYSASTKWNSSDPATNNETGICYIQTPITLTTPLQMSITWWAKPENGYGSGTGHAALCTSNNTSRPTDYNTTAFHHRDSGFDIYPSDASGVKRLSFTYTKNEWHHYALTYDGTTARSYQDGVEKSTVTVGTNKTLATFSQLYIGYSQAGGVKRKTLGSYSDFRIYCTALSADDIKQLYQVGAKVDNLQNIHTFEFIEDNATTKITKQGQLKTFVIQEAINQSLAYDKTLYIEPDGSTWIHIFHHNNPANSRFTGSANDWSNGLYIDADKWYNVEPFLNDTLPYEFMVKQKTTSGATETKYRWIQTPNPLTATWADVKPGTVTFITTSGYTNSSYGGMYLMKNSNLHMCIANASNGNWYGGIGVSSSYNGGIPGYPNTTVTSGYVDLYLRIYPTAKIIKNIGIGSNTLIER